MGKIGTVLLLLAAAVLAQSDARVDAPAFDALLDGVRSRENDVRFYAAEALAYLDRTEAAEPLGATSQLAAARIRRLWDQLY